MSGKRQQERRYVRWAGPEDRMHGEFRGEPVELLDWQALKGYRVRFPDGVTTWAHPNNLTDCMFRMDNDGRVVPLG